MWRVLRVSVELLALRLAPYWVRLLVGMMGAVISLVQLAARLLVVLPDLQSKQMPRNRKPLSMLLKLKMEI